MTNREWLESLTDEELSMFLTNNIMIKFRNGTIPEEYQTRIYPFCGGIQYVLRRYTSSQQGVEKWLKEDQEFVVVR